MEEEEEEAQWESALTTLNIKSEFKKPSESNSKPRVLQVEFYPEPFPNSRGVL